MGVPMIRGPGVDVRVVDNFAPPAGFISHILSAVKWIDATDFEGIDFVFVFDKAPQTRPGKNPQIEDAVRNGLLLFAAYNERSANDPPHIILIADSLYKPIPRFLWRAPALTLWIAENLAHEVAHHAIAERRYRTRPRADTTMAELEEEFAENYAKSVVARMRSKAKYRFAGFLLAIAAQIDYYKGAWSWWKGRYEMAADYFYLATQIKSGHSAASYWFWKAKEKAALHTA